MKPHADLVVPAQVSRDVIQGIPIMEQDLLAYRAANNVNCISGQINKGAEGACTGPATGWSLGGTGPVLKTQTIVSLEQLL